MKQDINFRCYDNHDVNINTYKPMEVKLSGKEYLAYGEDNQFPQMVEELIENCAILGTCTDAVVTYTSGAGITNDRQIDENGMMLSELLEKLVTDYINHGAFAVQLLRNTYGELVKLAYVNVANCRLDETGDFVYYSKNWGKYTRSVKKYSRWNLKNVEPNSIMYVKNQKTKGIYGKPMWSSCILDANTIIEASKSNHNSIINQFQPNVLISFNQGIPDQDTKDEMEKAIMKKYTGSNGSKILLTWSDSQDTAPTVEQFQTDDYTAKYESVMATCKNNIIMAFRISEQLLGINTSQGFNDIEYANSYALFYATQIRPIQDYIEKQFKKIGFDFRFNEFTVEFKTSGGGDIAM